MNTALAPLRGTLRHRGNSIPVQVGYASSISVYATFPVGVEPPHDAVFDGLVLEVEKRPVELCRCRLDREDDPARSGGRLVFLDDVYDFGALFREHKLVDLKNVFHNISLVISQKHAIQPRFKDYTASCVYDISVHKRFFNQQERLYANETANVRAAAQDALLRAERAQFFRLFDQTLVGLQEVTAGFEKEDHERHGFYFRRHVWEFIEDSAFLRRTNLKPRGYAGDSAMMEMIYQNQYVGSTVFNKLMHKHPLESAAAQAVRARRELVPSVLRRVQKQFSGLPAPGFRFLSVACGPAWELADLFTEEDSGGMLHCALLDQDQHALRSAQAVVERLQAARGLDVHVDYYNESVRTMLKNPRQAERWGRFHFLYSMGLFDYLTTPVARAVAVRLYDMLEPGGTMLIGNYHVGSPTRRYMEYWMDWVLYYRSEQEFLDLANALPGATASLFFESTGCQMFLEVRKPG